MERARSWDKAQNKEVLLGRFATEEDAARAYQDHVGHGDFVLKQEHSSQFKGVSWNIGGKSWYASYRDTVQQKNVHIGCFATEEDARRARQDHIGAKKPISAAAATSAAPAAPAAPVGQPATQHLTRGALMDIARRRGMKGYSKLRKEEQLLFGGGRTLRRGR